MSLIDLTTAQWHKSSRSTSNANCVEVAFETKTWRKSSFSSDAANCVEVAFAGPAVAVRDSKNPGSGALVLPAAPWTHFLHHVG